MLLYPGTELDSKFNESEQSNETVLIGMDNLNSSNATADTGECKVWLPDKKVACPKHRLAIRSLTKKKRPLNKKIVGEKSNSALRSLKYVKIKN